MKKTKPNQSLSHKKSSPQPRQGLRSTTKPTQFQKIMKWVLWVCFLWVATVFIFSYCVPSSNVDPETMAKEISEEIYSDLRQFQGMEARDDEKESTFKAFLETPPPSSFRDIYFDKSGKLLGIGVANLSGQEDSFYQVSVEVLKADSGTVSGSGFDVRVSVGWPNPDYSETRNFVSFFLKKQIYYSQVRSVGDSLSIDRKEKIKREEQQKKEIKDRSQALKDAENANIDTQ